MKTYFFTEIDEAANYKWPKMEFPPNIGDIIQSTSPMKKNKPPIQLQVIQRIFKTNECEKGEEPGETYCECILGKITE